MTLPSATSLSLTLALLTAACGRGGSGAAPGTAKNGTKAAGAAEQSTLSGPRHCTWEASSAAFEGPCELAPHALDFQAKDFKLHLNLRAEDYGFKAKGTAQGAQVEFVLWKQGDGAFAGVLSSTPFPARLLIAPPQD